MIVSGHAKGCGSSREHAVYAEKYAGVEIVFARSFERIYAQNCRNVGILTCDDFDLLAALLAGEELPVAAFTRRATDVPIVLRNLASAPRTIRAPRREGWSMAACRAIAAW